MKTFVTASALVAVAAFLAACASTDDVATPDQPRPMPEYRTGSNLPVRTPQPKTQAERDRAAQEADEARRNAEKILRPSAAP